MTLWPHFRTSPFLKKWTVAVVAFIAELLLVPQYIFCNTERESTRCRNLCGRSDPWTLAPPVGGQVASKQMLGTPHSTLHTPQREGRTLHRHLRPQALRIAEMFLTLSKEAHLEYFENHVKPVLSWKHRQPWKGQTVPAHPGTRLTQTQSQKHTYSQPTYYHYKGGVRVPKRMNRP